MLRWPLLILLGVGLMLPALILGPGATHSAIYNLTWTAEISDALRAGEAYPRWLHGAFAG